MLDVDILMLPFFFSAGAVHSRENACNRVPGDVKSKFLILRTEPNSNIIVLISMGITVVWRTERCKVLTTTQHSPLDATPGILLL